MRLGTPGFIGTRLTEGREARGLTQTSLAELTGIKSQSISHYEQGRQSPSPEALELLCEILLLPERFFLRSAPHSLDSTVFFRAQAAPAKPARVKAERLLGWLSEISAYVRQHVELPAPAFPDIPVDPAVAEASAEVERIADEVRTGLRLGFGPLGNPVGILEENGCIVSRFAMESELGGSCSKIDAGTACIMLRAEETRPTWSRFHAAHELGHLVMHRHIPIRDLAGDFADSQADRFARAFLLPQRVFAHEVWAPTIDALLTLKKEWRCPISVMVSRCSEIGVFDADQVRRALVNLGRRGWKSAEPREESIQMEMPQLLARGLRLIIEEGLRTAHSVAMELALNPADIEGLAGLKAGYFAGCEIHPPPALRLRRPDGADILHG
jgi:Zn-dependent peptidase ImmA (M78 family)/transcriptional regulator with XRE-family HTH domain